MDELEILKIAHETDPSFTARTYYADILKFGKAIYAAEREACKAATRSLNIGPQDAARWEVARTIERLIDERSNVEVTGAEPALSAERPR